MEFRPVIRGMFKINGSFKTCL